uniref:Uncharacterized protein n=1 Tax=Panagrolaimus davidi TaxID=227884 RepID=A0A914QGC9_9BILA
MDEKLNKAAEVIESDTRKKSMSSKASAEDDEKRNVNITTNEINTPADDIITDYGEKVDFGQDSESDDDEIFVTIGDIETNLPSQVC